MIIDLQLSSGKSASKSGSKQNVTIPFEGGMKKFKRQSAFVFRNGRSESVPPLKPSQLTCYKLFGRNSIIVLMFAEKQRMHIKRICKVCNEKLVLFY